MKQSKIKQSLYQKAIEEGFATIGISKPDLNPRNQSAFRNFIAAGHQGDMGWLADKADRRQDPKTLWGETKSIIMLKMNYGPEENPLKALEEKQRGVISVYAKGKDYHDVVKKKLKKIARWLVAETGAELKVFVDTAPVMEKPLAMQAGIGWQGKHTNLVSRQLGSWTFLGAIFTNLELTPDEEEQDHCGNCQKCLDICPTNAFPSPYKLDATRCISYLTIEHKGPIPQQLRQAMGNRIYGCDDCLAICPWNKFAQQATEQKLHPKAATDNPNLKDLLKLDDAAFRELFQGTPIKRTGRDRFLRNCLIAAGNSKEPRLKPQILHLLKDKEEPSLVRGAAIWAFRQLASTSEWQQCYKDHGQTETCPEIQAEWQHAHDQHP